MNSWSKANILRWLEASLNDEGIILNDTEGKLREENCIMKSPLNTSMEQKLEPILESSGGGLIKTPILASNSGDDIPLSSLRDKWYFTSEKCTKWKKNPYPSTRIYNQKIQMQKFLINFYHRNLKKCH